MITLIFKFRLISKDNEKIQNRYGRYFLSKKFKSFENKVRLFAKSQYRKPPIKENIRASIIASFTNKRHSDCSNLSKGILDALQGIIYLNDRQIKRYDCMVSESAPKDSFMVLIERIEN